MDQIKRSLHLLFLTVFLFTLALNKIHAQSCSGSWVNNNPFTFQCISGQIIGMNNFSEPVGCPVNPTYSATQTNTFVFDNTINNFSVDFNGFSTVPGCARMEIKINGTFYPLTAAMVTDLPAGSTCLGAFSSIAVTTDGYITGSLTSPSNFNGQGRIIFSNVNANSITISTNDAGGGSIFTSPCSPVVVPIKLKSFIGAEQKTCKAILDWESGVEANVKNIEILTSSNGTDFKKITEVLPKGSNSHYTIETDQFANTYYKLKINDLDGKYQYSQTIYIKSTCDRAIYQISPNPAHNYFKITNLKINDRVIIFDILGKTELVKVKQDDQALNIHNLAIGVYYLKVIHEGKISANLKMINY